jgi:beta-fructofuranosidase
MLKLTLSIGDQILVQVEYVPERNTWVADGKSYPVQPGDRPTIQAYVDGSVIEMVLSERLGYTKRFYYAGSLAPEITFRAAGVSLQLEGWDIKPITTNRLTTVT